MFKRDEKGIETIKIISILCTIFIFGAIFIGYLPTGEVKMKVFNEISIPSEDYRIIVSNGGTYYMGPKYETEGMPYYFIFEVIIPEMKSKESCLVSISDISLQSRNKTKTPIRLQPYEKSQQVKKKGFFSKPKATFATKRAYFDHKKYKISFRIEFSPECNQEKVIIFNKDLVPIERIRTARIWDN